MNWWMCVSVCVWYAEKMDGWVGGWQAHLPLGPMAGCGTSSSHSPSSDFDLTSAFMLVPQRTGYWSAVEVAKHRAACGGRWGKSDDLTRRLKVLRMVWDCGWLVWDCGWLFQGERAMSNWPSKTREPGLTPQPHRFCLSLVLCISFFLSFSKCLCALCLSVCISLYFSCCMYIIFFLLFLIISLCVFVCVLLFFY